MSSETFGTAERAASEPCGHGGECVQVEGWLRHTGRYRCPDCAFATDSLAEARAHPAVAAFMIALLSEEHDRSERSGREHVLREPVTAGSGAF